MRRLLLLALLPAVLPAPVGANAIRPFPLVIAHRGGAAYAPENTMAAYRHAVLLGADALEGDTQLTADGELVLVHDDSLDRTTDCTGDVVAKTYAQVQACDAAWWFAPGRGAARGQPSYPLRGQGIRIPKAEELFAFVAALVGDRPAIDIEIKDIPGEANFDAAGTQVAGPLVALIHRYPGLDVTVQSFWPPALEEVKRLDPSIRTHFLTLTAAWANLAWTAARGHQVSSTSFASPDHSADYVGAAHLAGKEVWPYTVNQRADVDAVLGIGVDGVISDWPACVLGAEGRPVLIPEAELWLGSAAGRACP